MTDVSKRKFLIVTSSTKTAEHIKSIIEKHIAEAQFLFATNGSEAMSKIQNDPPTVLLTEITLNKVDGFKLVDWVLKQKNTDKVSVIFFAKLPEQNKFVDQVVTNQIQFVNPESNEHELQMALAKALNYSSHKDKQEFYLKFLAPGDHLIKEGDSADFVYLVKRGELTAYTEVNGNTITLGKIITGEFVGEMAYINGEKRSATVIAESDCELIELPIGSLDQVLFTKPSWSKALMKTLSKRVKNYNNKEKTKKSA